MRQFAAAILVAMLVLGCKSGGGSDQPGTVPAAASAMDAALKSSMVRVLPLGANLETSLISVLNPGTPLAQGVTVQPDTSPGAAPHSVTFGGPFDGNGDGYDETTTSGRATFSSDPDASWSGMNGQVTVDVGIPIVGHLYHAEVAFTVTTAERRLSGSGTFTDPLSGNVTTMTVAAAAPLVVRPATGAAGAVSNACGHSLDGRMALEVAGSSGRLRSTWSFSPGKSTVAVDGTAFTDPSGKTTALPASTVELRCGSAGGVGDWAATYLQRYVCLPRESGEATLTLAVAGPDSIGIGDEDPPGSGVVKQYGATIVAANPHAVRGYFIGGPDGSRYREDFSWTLGKDGRSFSQVSSYTYFEGPASGSGGLCVGSARRVP